MTRATQLVGLSFALCTWAGSTSAQGTDASLQLGSSGATADASAAGAATAEDEGGGLGNEAGTTELGLYGGVFLPSSRHELLNAKSSFHEIERVVPEFGLRAGYDLLDALGLELEAGFLPSQTRDTSASVSIFAVRANALLLAPTTTIVPFFLIGGGMLGVASEQAALGADVDGELHLGIGAKAYVSRSVAIRLDLRDDITNGTNGAARDKLAMHWEALAGVSLILGRQAPARPLPPAPPPPPPDSDGDGVDDGKDLCRNQAGVAPDGCPLPDGDADGVPDAYDACPKDAGPASADTAANGCPPPPADGDGDGVPDASDRCPTVAGDGADGCIADADADGVRDTEDKCGAAPETKNGFEDQDGCPDELPVAVQKFTGTIEGIVFETGKSTIKKVAFAKLDAAVEVLAEYSALRLEVSGHTDDTGSADKNTQLSKERAEAVKAYFVSKGIAADRIEARGAGSSEPVADNATNAGRGKNRRIEFKLLQ